MVFNNKPIIVGNSDIIKIEEWTDWTEFIRNLLRCGSFSDREVKVTNFFDKSPK